MRIPRITGGVMSVPFVTTGAPKYPGVIAYSLRYRELHRRYQRAVEGAEGKSGIADDAGQRRMLQGRPVRRFPEESFSTTFCGCSVD